METLTKRTICLLLIAMTANAETIVTVLDYNSDPIQNLNVSFRDITTLSVLNTSLTNSTGSAAYSGADYNLSILLTFPETNQTAEIKNATISSKVYINDFVSADFKVVNLIGQPQEAVSCSVAAFNDKNELVHDYKTMCQKGEPFYDANLNYATLTGCTFTDSLGMYHFTGSTNEFWGFDNGENYSLIITCSGQKATLTFTPEGVKHTDLTKWQDDLMKNAGIYLIYVFIFIIALLITPRRYTAYIILAGIIILIYKTLI